MKIEELAISVSDAVAVINQTFSSVYPVLTITGELSSFRISKGKWVYFDLKDEYSKLPFFGTVYSLPAPLEDGMLITVVAEPRVHPQFGFSFNIRSIQLAGEGTIKKATQLLQEKLTKEGLFDADRKRKLPYPPERIGLITSVESAAYADFTKILDSRWRGLEIIVKDVQVQGLLAVEQITSAIESFNLQSELVDILVIIRGGGSADDLSAFSSEQLTRAVSASRIPTIVAVGHEVDVCLAELAADVRASTPSNAAEIIVPTVQEARDRLRDTKTLLDSLINGRTKLLDQYVSNTNKTLNENLNSIFEKLSENIHNKKQVLEALNPSNALKRGYAIIKSNSGVLIKTVASAKQEKTLNITLSDGQVQAEVK